MLLNTTCKQGKLQLTEDGYLQVTQLFSKDPTWRESVADIRSIDVQAGRVMRTIAVHASQDYFVGNLSANDIAKLRSLLPDVAFQDVKELPQNQATPAHAPKPAKPRHWWEDDTKLTHVATYTKEKNLQTELEAAYQHGWEIQGQSAQAGKVSGRKVIGGALVGGLLTGGIGLGVGALAGAKRDKDKTTITYVRSDEWRAQHRRTE